MGLEFASTNGTITCNGKRVHIKGTNWFGLETDTYSLHGLWSVSLDSILGFLSDNDFNAVRIPLSVELVEKLKTDKIKSVSANPGLVDMTIEAFLDHVFKKCAEKGILVMLDMHLLKASAPIPELWYSSEFPEERSIAAWRTLVTRYQKHWNFFACDLKNEPHGAATWGDGAKTDWRAAAERIGNSILALCPRMLIFVEGNDGQGKDISWWGGYLALAHPSKSPVRLSVPNRLVYSPHVYGPDVHDKDMFKAATFPKNVPEYWRRWVHYSLLLCGYCSARYKAFLLHCPHDYLWFLVRHRCAPKPVFLNCIQYVTANCTQGYPVLGYCGITPINRWPRFNQIWDSHYSWTRSRCWLV
jgi:endoglucanase